MESKRILVVEDELDVRAYLQALLEDHGFEVEAVGSAEEAREILGRDGPPDLLCLDIMMPKQSGIALYQECKLDERYRDVPAIFVSAFSLARDFHGQGFRKLIPDERVPEPVAYIEKPVKVERLLDAVERAVGVAVPPD